MSTDNRALTAGSTAADRATSWYIPLKKLLVQPGGGVSRGNVEAAMILVQSKLVSTLNPYGHGDGIEQTVHGTPRAYATTAASSFGMPPLYSALFVVIFSDSPICRRFCRTLRTRPGDHACSMWDSYYPRKCWLRGTQATNTFRGWPVGEKISGRKEKTGLGQAQLYH